MHAQGERKHRSRETLDTATLRQNYSAFPKELQFLSEPGQRPACALGGVSNAASSRFDLEIGSPGLKKEEEDKDAEEVWGGGGGG